MTPATGPARPPPNLVSHRLLTTAPLVGIISVAWKLLGHKGLRNTASFRDSGTRISARNRSLDAATPRRSHRLVPGAQQTRQQCRAPARQHRPSTRAQGYRRAVVPPMTAILRRSSMSDPIRNDETAVGTVPWDPFQLMDRLDEEAFRRELEGVASTDLVYVVKEGGQEIVGLSKTGVDACCM